MKEYARGPYNKFNDTEQWIRLSEGCPNNCEFCRETKECGKDPIYFPIPEIVRNKVKIMDMNLLYKPKALEIIETLGKKKVNNRVVYYELICGIDWRYLSLKIAFALKKARFGNIRFAWDFGFELQKEMQGCVKNLQVAGYEPQELSCFMICNWKTSYRINRMKLDLLKVWNIKANDCWFDNQVSPNIKPVFWTKEQIKDFRAKCRKHNQLVRFRIDPEYGKKTAMF